MHLRKLTHRDEYVM